MNQAAKPQLLSTSQIGTSLAKAVPNPMQNGGEQARALHEL